MKFSMERANNHFRYKGTTLEALILLWGFILSGIISIFLMIAFITLKMIIPFDVLVRAVILNMFLYIPLLKALWVTREK